ncbi:MAG: hypothetical protein ACO1QS_04615 [Verrucomicrobiota bacterium]
MDWIHLHLALNHVPVLGTLFVCLLLLTAAVRKEESLKRLSLWWTVALMLISIPLKFTGDFAAEKAGKEPWFIETLVQAHEQAADQATTGIFLMGIAAIMALVIARKARPVATWSLMLTLVVGLLTFALMARAANLGGQIRHTEIRPALTLAP